MAVLAEAISVIVKADSINRQFPGGWEAFMGWVRNRTLCADNEVARVGFMSPSDAKAFISELETLGLRYLEHDKAIDIVVADQQHGLQGACDWAQFGRVPWEGDMEKQVPAVRLIRSTLQELVFPDGWSYEGSIVERSLFIETGHIPEFLDFLRTERGLDVYRDLRTGREVFIPEQKK